MGNLRSELVDGALRASSFGYLRLGSPNSGIRVSYYRSRIGALECEVCWRLEQWRLHMGTWRRGCA